MRQVTVPHSVSILISRNMIHLGTVNLKQPPSDKGVILRGGLRRSLVPVAEVVAILLVVMILYGQLPPDVNESHCRKEAQAIATVWM